MKPLLLMLPLWAAFCAASLLITLAPAGSVRAEDRVELPEPSTTGRMSLEEALNNRRSRRSYKEEALSLAEAGQMLWAAQGVTSERGFRTAPSAGALYPLEVYLAAGDVEGLPAGVYRYDPEEHALVKTVDGDVRPGLSDAALGQSSPEQAPASIVITGVYERTMSKYGRRGMRYVLMEAGHAAQNVYLQAVSLELGTVTLGAFQDDRAAETLKLPEKHRPLYIMPVGGI